MVKLEFYTYSHENTMIALDTETNAEDIRDGRGYCQGISMAFRQGNYVDSIYIPIRHIDGENNISHDRVSRLKDFLENYKGWLVMHNSKFDLVSLRTAGIDYQGKFYDTMLMCHLINENLPYSKSLEACVAMYCKGVDGKKNDAVFKRLVETLGWGGITSFVMEEYGEHDAYITLLLCEKILKKFNEEVKPEYWEHKQNFVRVIMAMESRGVRIDTDICRQEAQKGTTRLEEITRETKANLGSGKDLERLLIDQLGLPVVKKSPKTGKPSFDKEAMAEYDELLAINDDPLAKLIFEYRGWQKAVSSNYRPYIALQSMDGRLRPNYKLHGTKTGRMSCEKPNLQQIPRISDKAWNGSMKAAFIPQEGYELWEFDYSQLELRLATAYADEKFLKQVFEEGRDIFTEMAEVIGFPRQETKSFVYSTQYGAGIAKIATLLKISLDRAMELKSNYQRQFPGFQKVTNLASVRCKTNGAVSLWSGRRRHFKNRSDDAHKAFNSAIQGGAADIVEHVMVRLFNNVDDDKKCRMLLQVHDSVLFEIRKDCVEEYKEQIKLIMEDVQPDFGVKFAVDGKIWGTAG